MRLIAYVLTVLALVDIVLSTKNIISIIKSKNPNKKAILIDKSKLVISTTVNYIGNWLLIIYCLINLYI